MVSDTPSLKEKPKKSTDNYKNQKYITPFQQQHMSFNELVNFGKHTYHHYNISCYVGWLGKYIKETTKAC